ncbi:hypothetical protein U27_06203 [Candidatus Vecturithrix granuli]|uniref:DUF4935 domain-containing protein n=1 Tax=Vecturithrix granuli TaxID=1499967 RepID=A0A081C3S1_VECG1|nr:hypothetical protein U27_06203 [Candidatus Vecturithrix granuli]
MIAVVDACTILNLLQSVFDGKYIEHLQRLFDQIVIHPKVFEEVNDNKYDNLYAKEKSELAKLKDDLDNLISSYIPQFTTYEDVDEFCGFLKTVTKYTKDNGEFYSIALSLYLSRMGEIKLNENVLKTCFVSDDDIAKDDFGDFVRINQIGQFLDSIDIVILCYLKEYISKKEILNFCISLKALYNSKISPLIDEIETMRKIRDSPPIQHTLSTLSEYIKNNDVLKLRELERDPNVVKIKRAEKKFAQLFGDFLESDIGVKIKYIDDRQKAIENDHVWKI